MKRRDLLKGVAAVGVAGAVACGRPGGSGPKRAAAAKTLRIIHSENLSTLDPIWTTQPATKDYGFMTFDQLIAVDESFAPKPQMAEGWTVEDGGHTFTISLREGLKFHDGEPVRSQDCIPSIKRWGVRDGFGQLAMKFVDDMKVVDDRRFSIRLNRPFALLPDALGKATSSVCVIMPERMAKTDAFRPVTEPIGSGPFRFLKDEWVTGSHAAWAKFDGYIPRKEPVSGIAGGKIPAVDRIEWSIIGDPSTAMAALLAGEQDYWDFPPPDLISTISADPSVVVRNRNKSGGYMMMQFNHLQPPFNNPAIRQAVALAVDQEDFMRAATNDRKLMKACYSVYACGTRYASEAGSDLLKIRNLDRGKAALKAAGYSGEKVVLLGVQGPFGSVSQVADDLLRRLGMNVEFVTVDFATLAQRRLSKAPVDKGGWSAFLTGWTGGDILNPAVNQMLRGAGEKGYAGWANDPTLEHLRDSWAAATSPADLTRLATEIQVEAFKTMPYVPLGSTFGRVAYRTNVTGVFPAPVGAYWNIGKSS